MKDAFLLFFRRENKQLQGRNLLCLWVTVGVFLVAILSAGFSVASMDYLQEKMSDPFVTCIDIPVSQSWSKGYEELEEFLAKPSNQLQLGYQSVEKVNLISDYFQVSPEKSLQLDGRTLYMNSPLKGPILSNNNVIQQRIEPIKDSDFGLIICEEGLDKLDLKGDDPAFLRQVVYIDDSIYTFSVPILAIVKRLPNMCDFIATYAYAQQDIAKEGAHHFDLSKDQYNKELRLVALDSQQEDIKKFIAKQEYVTSVATQPYFGAWSNEYSMLIVKSDLDNRKDYFNELFKLIQKKYPEVERIIDFQYDPDVSTQAPQIVSCYFKQDSLEYKIEQFGTILKQETKYMIDMSKVENLKNIARVQQMGNTLSFCILLIVVVFISVFIYFLLNTHFQKIQRNLGTFKAFGVSESMIRKVYLLIISNLIVSAYAIAMAVSWVISKIVNTFMPITDDNGQYARFDCIVWQNGALLLVTLAFAILTTILVVKRLLSYTPGDLIYNRNQD